MRYYKFPSYPVGKDSEHLIDDGIIDKWLAVPVIIKPNSFLAKLGSPNRYRGNKIAHDPLNCMHGNAPDPEKTKYMINAKCIEAITHLLKPSPPPGKSILLHPFPVIC